MLDPSYSKVQYRPQLGSNRSKLANSVSGPKKAAHPLNDANRVKKDPLNRTVNLPNRPRVLNGNLLEIKDLRNRRINLPHVPPRINNINKEAFQQIYRVGQRFDNII